MTASTEHALASELERLDTTRDELVDRLERVLIALAVTMDAQVAVGDRLIALGGVSADRAANIRRLELLADRCHATLRALRGD